MNVKITWMVRVDMPAVLEIEKLCFEFPWPEEDFIRCLRQRNCIGMVAAHGAQVVGYIIYELHKTRIHILNLAVTPAFQGKGVGRQIIEKMLGKLASQRRVRLTLEVRETNLDAQLFFKAMGFQAVSVLKGYYENSEEDAYLMQYRVPEVKGITHGACT